MGKLCTSDIFSNPCKFGVHTSIRQHTPAYASICQHAEVHLCSTPRMHLYVRDTTVKTAKTVRFFIITLNICCVPMQFPCRCIPMQCVSTWTRIVMTRASSRLACLVVNKEREHKEHTPRHAAVCRLQLHSYHELASLRGAKGDISKRFISSLNKSKCSSLSVRIRARLCFVTFFFAQSVLT